MTTSFTGEPDPNNPAVPQANPSVTAPMPPPAPKPSDPAHSGPPSNNPDHRAPGPDAGPPPPGPAAPATTGPAAGSAEGPEDPQTYTTTEPGFPIGQLISALAQPAISAATTLPTMAMSLAPMALGLAGPLLSSMLALLGQPGVHPQPNNSAPPPRRSPDPVTHSRGEALDRYHDQAQRLNDAAEGVHDRDHATADVVAQGHAIHAAATSQIRAIAARINDAAARTPTSPEGAAALERQIRAGLADARCAISAAQADYSQLAAHLTAL